MKIVAILESDVASGGGFNQALNAILQMRELCRGRYDFEVLTTRAGNVGVLRDLGVTAEAFAYGLADRLLLHLGRSSLWHRAQLRLRWVGPFERNLRRRGCDLVYFVAPSAQAAVLQRLAYITTVWDLCHRDAPEFPEVSEMAEFKLREELYGAILPRAIAVLTDSRALADALARRYGIDPARLLPMPFAPAPQLSAPSTRDKAAVLSTYGLEEGYFFYPAQLWAHKNHARILHALQLLAKEGRRPAVVFAGGDQGNRGHVERLVRSFALQDQVRMLGFVPGADMRGLYEGCRAVVMPTYFGPTNIPPLEAWLLRRPLIYSAQFAEQAGDAALLVDPDDADALAAAMRDCLDPAVGARLVEAGARRLREIEGQREAAEAELLAHLRRFETRRACWA
jgi:glycosyltransferase involved in cell wall biosynthesis